MRLQVMSAVLVAAASALVVAPAFADARVPAFDVTAYDQTPGHQTRLDFEFALLESASTAQTIVLSEPAGYETALTTATGDTIGDAKVDLVSAAGGHRVRYTGSLVAGDAGTVGAVEACAPGTHVATWHLVVSGATGGFTIPIAVDRGARGAYRFTICLDAFRAARFKPVDVWFAVRHVFRNPPRADTYRWSAIVTPATAAGAADPTTAFELRADEPLPEAVSVRAVYAGSRAALVVRGRLKTARSVRPGIHVHVYAGPTSSNLTEIGVATTADDGTYVFRRRLAQAPRYVDVEVHHDRYQSCRQPSTAPAGCASETMDGALSELVRTVVVAASR